MKKKKILIFSGTHPRHIYVSSAILKFKEKIEIKIIFMKREEINPKPEKNLNKTDKKNFIFHFNKRKEKEYKNFGNLKYEKIFKNINYNVIKSNKLNSKKTYNLVKKFNPDLVFIFGIDLIKKPLINFIKDKSINLHLGLSPWYKGSATLFWPFYMLQPQYAGVTFHRITNGIDDGEILHQSTPKLSKNDGIHDVAIKAVKKSKKDLEKIFIKFLKNKKFKFYKQNKNAGKTFYTNTFKSHHLRLIYDLFNDKIVRYYLNNKKRKKIKLISFV